MKVFSFILLFLIFGCSKNAEEVKDQHSDHAKEKVYYTCAMHPQIKSDKPGRCPICKMILTKIEISEAESEVSEHKMPEVWLCKDFPDVTSEHFMKCPIDGSPMIKKTAEMEAGLVIKKVKLRKAQLNHFKPDFFPVTTMKMSKNIRLLGAVFESEENESKIPARVSGRVEKVFVRVTGAFIKKGDPVLKIYSPQLITGGEEYLLARKSYNKTKGKAFKDLYMRGKEKLNLWGVKDFQLKSWYEKGKIPRSITIYSPATGIVQKKNAVEGKYFKEGQNFFELSDLTTIWIEMDVYEQDSGLVNIGQEVDLKFSALPGEVLKGKIDFINPVLDPKSRTLKVRATIENPYGYLRPGMVAESTLKTVLKGNRLVIPRTAIIDTGKRKVVWQKISDDTYQAKTIHTGFESEGYVEIKKGLEEGDFVVLEGNFLLDAQSQLFGGHEDFGHH